MHFTDTNGMTIQIGLQCVNQSNPININSPTEMNIPNHNNNLTVNDNPYNDTKRATTYLQQSPSSNVSNATKTLSDLSDSNLR